MTNTTSDPLYILVKSLSKSEKRQFKLYVGRLDVNVDSKFLALFNILDKMNEYDEEQIIESGVVKKQQLSNLKAHLYRQILVSLRLNPSHHNIRYQIRELFDFATILYHKGLYKQSLKLLEKAKNMALENEEKFVAYEIVEMEKVIESQYITRSISGRADELSIQAKDLSVQNVLVSKLSNLSLQLYSIMLKTGYVKSDEEYQKVTDYFKARMPEYEWSSLGFRELLWLYKAHLWYSFLVQDFISCYRYASKWVGLFYENPKMITLNPVFFLKGNHYLLESLYLLRHRSKFIEVLKNLEQTLIQPEFPKNDNVQSLVFLYIYGNRLNRHFFEGTFKEGLTLVDEVLSKLNYFQEKIDEHHVMVFYYKIACMYFGTGDNKSCIKYLKLIIDNKSLSMREDLMCFARVLSLVAHYEAGMDYSLEVQLRSTYKFLIKMNDLHEVQKAMIRFLRNLGNVFPQDLKKEFQKLRDELKKYEDDPYERRAFLYLDIISWLESKVEGRPIGDIIREKAKAIAR